MAACLFIPVWTLRYWQAWVLLTVFFVSGGLTTLYLWRHDRKLLERRASGGPTAEKEKSQQLIQLIAGLGFVGLLIVPALDHRFMWSHVPTIVNILGDALILFGEFAIFIVFKQNTFASATIELAPEQHVISTGLYGIVRHPMYAGAFFLLVGIPLALGSWWGLLVIVAMMPALIWRLIDEEKFLVKNLPGYAEYRTRVRYRLIPFVW